MTDVKPPEVLSEISHKDVPLRIPHVVATIVKGMAVIVCPYCGKKHTHGAENGYRTAHCGAGAGYTLTLPDLEILK